MKHSESIKEIATALTKFQAEISGVARTTENPFYKSKYANLGAIWETIRDPLTKHGLSVVQLPADAESPEYVALETTVIHDSGEWISERFTMALVRRAGSTLAMANDPQSVGSAITYMRRYALTAVLGIHQDDDDANQFAGDEDVNNATGLIDYESNLWNAEIITPKVLQALNKAFLKMPKIGTLTPSMKKKLDPEKVKQLIDVLSDLDPGKTPGGGRRPIDIARLKTWITENLNRIEQPQHRDNWINKHLGGSNIDAVEDLGAIANAVSSLAEKAETRKQKGGNNE